MSGSGTIGTQGQGVKTLAWIAVGLLLVGINVQGGAYSDALEAYWTFDSYTTGSNPSYAPQTGITGSFVDMSGHSNTAYGTEISGGSDYEPYDATGGKFGGALYSVSINNDGGGGMAVVGHNDSINFNAESFTISFWEKSQYRDVSGGGWGDGRGRSQFFTKAPYIPAEDPNVTKEGYGLNLTQNHFDLLSNDDDNFGQLPLGARYTFPSGTTPAYDSGVWAHWAITGQYNAGSDDYTITTYLNGSAVDWDGAAGTTITVTNSIIDNTGNLTIGAFWRNNANATQRCISWAMLDQTASQVDGKGWMDDFAMFNTNLSAGAAIAIGKLGAHAELQYPLSDVMQLLDVHAAGVGSITISDVTWHYATGLGGDDGQLTEGGGALTLVLDSSAGTGLIGRPPGTGTVLISR